MTSDTEVNETQPHMLDGCDLDECYKTMMSERTELIKARREAEDTLVKTIIQLSATLIALIAGFITQTSVQVEPRLLPVLILALILLVLSLASGLSEHIFSSKAYLAQQKLVEQFYSRKINSFDEPWENKWVRRCQVASFGLFVSALISLATFSVFQAGEKSNGKSIATTAAPATTPAAPATTPAAPPPPPPPPPP
uniref:hypothetical protein n=1 Tax=Allosphingosinicella vermicomposti TaxID=614671 RepID=UPI0018F87BD2